MIDQTNLIVTGACHLLHLTRISTNVCLKDRTHYLKSKKLRLVNAVLGLDTW